MTTETMTIHKALSELKIIDDRIEKLISNSVFVKENRHSNQKVNGVSIDEYKTLITSSYDKITDLLNRQKALKSAVSLSNAATKVTINDTEYTVAEAIWMKNHGIESDLALLDVLKSQLTCAIRECENNNGKKLEDKTEVYLTNMFGSKEKANVQDIDIERDKFIKAQTYELIDPLNISNEINKLESKINQFFTEVDSALSVSNALTNITIEY